MIFQNPHYKIYHLMLLAAMIAGFLVYLPPGFNCFFVVCTLIAFFAVPVCKPETIVGFLAYVLSLAIVEGLVVFACIAACKGAG
jgi:hypothetical protein